MPRNDLTNGFSSPLRYPGGKGKITRFVDHILVRNAITGTYVEPFAGGAGIAMNLLLHNRIQNILINDLDDGVFSFWQVITTSPALLMEKIKEVPFDTSNGLSQLGTARAYWYWYRIHARYKANDYHNLIDKAFDFFMLNRMNVSGIINGGPIGGMSQSGTYNISSRFNKYDLIHRIESIRDMKSHISVHQYEASFLLQHLSELCDTENCLVFADPPYYVQGKNLYNTYATDSIHRLVAQQLLNEPDWRWILTYDEAPEIDDLYPINQVNKFEYEITYSANKRGTYSEFLFADPRLDIESYDNVHIHSLSFAKP